MKKTFFKNKKIVFFGAMLALCVFARGILVHADASSATPATPISSSAQVETSGGGLDAKVAPGDYLPIVVKLRNFGEGNKVDVLVTYDIINSQSKIIFSENETVAVETTASYVKKIQIPLDASAGIYIAEASVQYQGQLVAASAEFPFVIESKFLGVFQNWFVVDGGIALLIGFIVGLVGRFFHKRYRRSRMEPIDYSKISKDKRPLFELISDTILEMRERIGDRAIDIAHGISGLKIDEKTGKVSDISDDPGVIMKKLTEEYEKVLGKDK